MTRFVSALLSGLAILLLVSLAEAQQKDAQAQAEPSASELAKQTQNPIASLISFPLETNWDMGIGDRKATGTLLNIQPVVPFSISKNTNIVLRVIAPLSSQPTSETDGSRINGLGDILFSAFFVPAKSGRVTWGVGPAMLLPTATDVRLGAEKFGIGPTAVVLTQPGKWTFGLLANQIWSTSWRHRPGGRQQNVPAAVHALQLGKWTLSGCQRGGDRQLESPRGKVEFAAAVQRQQGGEAREAAGELQDRRWADIWSRGRTGLAASFSDEFPVPAIAG